MLVSTVFLKFTKGTYEHWRKRMF